MKIKNKIVAMVVGLSLISSPALMALDNTAEESLSKGKKFYAEGRYSDAMDSFINVFVSGNPDQIAEANEYVNLIHFDRGGVVPPKQVAYDKDLEKKQNLGVQGKIMSGKKEQEKTVEPKKEELREVPVVDNKLEEPVQEEAKEVAATENVKPQKQAVDADVVTAKADKQDKDNKDVKQEASSEQNAFAAAAAANEKEGTEAQQPAQEEAAEEVQAEEPEEIEEEEEEEEIEEEPSFPKGSKAKIYKLQKKDEAAKRLEMREALLAQIKNNDDINIYMRGGRVDAIDITANALFKGSSANINKKSDKILDIVYSLMILEDAPTYFVLPEGSYTDEVTLHGVRQAVALNSYLINRGISSAKMKLNMGLTTQEPPEKFSNLEGISIVFDYEGEENLKLKLKEKNLPPVLSLAVYPFKEITPALGETFVIDFSVVEATAPMQKWSLQIIHHAADSHYYVVKQLSGEDALSYQMFWNGHKRYFGQLLPAGKYTVVLKATDKEGREKLLKRQLILKESPVQEKPVKKTEAQVVKEEKAKLAKEAQAKAEKTLDYNQKRLWKKPGKKNMGAVVEEEKAEVTSDNQVQGEQNTGNIAAEPADNTEPTNNVGTNTNPYEGNTNPYDSPDDDGAYSDDDF